MKKIVQRIAALFRKKGLVNSGTGPVENEKEPAKPHGRVSGGYYRVPTLITPDFREHKDLARIIGKHIEHLNYIKMVIEFVEEIEPDHIESIQSHWLVRYKKLLEVHHKQMSLDVSIERICDQSRDTAAEELDAEIWVDQLLQGKRPV